MSHSTNQPLIDPFMRRINYLRISVTDRCDFRCLYCMSEQLRFLPRAQLLTLEEIAELARAFTELGIDKIRITGGEPLVRNNVLWLFEQLGALPGLRELALTTNGSQLPKLAAGLRAAGVQRINISLDSLQADRFRQITRTGELSQVLAGIKAAQAAGFTRLKLNAVILKHRNHDEVLDLVAFAVAEGLDISFIEEMPLGVVGSHDRAAAYYSSEQIRHDLASRYTLLPTTETTGGPSRYYRLAAYPDTRVGFIAPHSQHFCETCNRLRLTVEGRLLLCLGQEQSLDLRRVIRGYPGDREKWQQQIRAAVALKPQGHDFNLEHPVSILRYMNLTGG